MKFTLFLLSILWSEIVFSEVKVTINETVYYYQGNPRLTEVLAPEALSAPWYWSASALFRLNRSNIEALRTEVLLDIQETIESQPDSQSLKVLEEQVLNWSLADRIFIPIDFDLARSHPKYNPKLEDGEYLLILKERPVDVSLIGMLDKPNIVKFDEGVTVEKYLTDIRALEDTEVSYVYIIQGNGDITKSGVAYWNNTHDQVMPGGQVFIPISESQFSNKNKILNEKIALLAANRIIN